MPRSKGYKSLAKIIKRGSIGALIGGTSSRLTSESHSASDNMKAGAAFGAAAAVFAPVAARKIAKKVKTSKPVFKARANARKGKVIFRRIRGKLVPIRKKQ